MTSPAGPESGAPAPATSPFPQHPTPRRGVANYACTILLASSGSHPPTELGVGAVGIACMDASHACAWRVCIHSVRACLAVPYRACIHAWRADMHVCARVACVRRVRDRCGMHPTSRSAIAVSRERNARVVAIRCFAWRLLSLCWPSPSGRVPISAWVCLFFREENDVHERAAPRRLLDRRSTNDGRPPPPSLP